MFLQLNGMRLPNNSLVDIDDIPDDSIVGLDAAVATALMCVTDLVDCCNSGEQNTSVSLGEWYHPNGSLVVFNAGDAMFHGNRGQSVVRLWRSGNPVERGRFRCELSNNQHVNQTNYVSICELSD